MDKAETEIFYPANQAEWRKWLKKNHSLQQSVWVVFYNKSSSMSTLTWSDAVDEALCFGWIDSKKISIDKEKSHQFFSKRKPVSTWSKINKAKIERLIADGKMTKAGLEIIETAKRNGSWSILDDVEELIIPKELEKEFKKHKGSKDFFMSLSKSVKKMLLQWIALAKQEETKQKRIKEIAEHAAQGQKPKQFR